MKLASVMLMACLSAYGADQAWFRLLGFSEDGKYLAWEEGGVQDGSGFPWQRVIILDTETSTEVESSYKVWEDELREPEEGFFNTDRNGLVMEYGIDTPPEDPLVYRPLTDLAAQGDSLRFCLEYYCPGYYTGEYVLRLERSPAAPGNVEGYPDWFPEPVVLSLTVADTDFFHEEEPPEEYGYVFGYGFAGIYRNPIARERLVVVLHSVMPGFEGADGRFRVVSGELP